MKFLIITHLFEPDRGGGASVFSDLCFGLAEKGHHVDVLTGYPYYPEWRNKAEANLWRVRYEMIRGARIGRYGFYIPSRPSSLFQRLVYELSYPLSLFRSVGKGGSYDLVMVYCPLLGSVLFAVLRKWLRGDRLWLNVQDIPADAAAASGISKSRVFDHIASAVQMFLFRQADIVSTISPVMLRRVEGIIGGDRSAFCLPNWLNKSMEDCIKALPRKIGGTESRPVKLVYAGNIGKKQGLVTFCERLAASLHDFEFRVFGDGAEAPAVKAWIERRRDARFSFGGFLSEGEFVCELHLTDYFVITETSQVGASFIPSKLIPCISTGTPVLAICNASGPLGSEVNEYGLGIQLDWDALHNLGESLGSALRGSECYEKLSHSCAARSLAYRRDHIINLIENHAQTTMAQG